RPRVLARRSHAGRRRHHVRQRADPGRADHLSGQGRAAPGPGEAPAGSGGGRYRGVLALVGDLRARRHAVDRPAGRRHRLPGLRRHRLQLHRQPVAAQALPPERALRALPHPADLRRGRGGDRVGRAAHGRRGGGNAGRHRRDRVDAAVTAWARQWRLYNRFMPTRPSRSLEVVSNPHPDRDYEVAMTAPEFTCVCPMTGQPDFATIRIRYVPDQHLVELKSLKLYLWSYRDEGAFHEDVTNRILNDFVTAARPRFVEVVGDFSVRGGIKTEVRATYGKRPEI